MKQMLFVLCVTATISLFSISCDLSIVQTAWHESIREKTERNETSWCQAQAEMSSVSLHPYTPFYSNRVGCIILAGGQGSRLGAEIPKGAVPIPPTGTTLFEIFMRKIVGFHSLYKIWPACAIMTSDETDTETKKYFRSNNFFGVPEENIFFFCQSNLPLLNDSGEAFYENGALIYGPDGNGKVFSAFCQSGVLQMWKEKNIQAVLFMPVDNPLMDPFLPALFKPVLEGRDEACFAAIRRKSATEKTGVFFVRDQRLHVVEYSEISNELRSATTVEGALLHPWANISVGVLSLDTLEKVSSVALPVHFAKKMRGKATIFKPEYFIFDNFPFISTFSVVGLDRKRFFSPIKNKTGEDSLEMASRDFCRVQKEQAQRAGKEEEKILHAEALDPAELYGCE